MAEKKETAKKFCIKCGAEMAEDSNFCSKCGYDNLNGPAKETQSKKKKMPTWAIVLIVIGAILLLGSCGGFTEEGSSTDGGNSGTSQKEEKPTSKPKEKFSLIEHKVSDDSNKYYMYIEGKIKNNTNKDYSYVQVTFKTFDKEGNTLDSCLDNVSGLDSDGVWKFKAICTADVNEIDRYELDEITGW